MNLLCPDQAHYLNSVIVLVPINKPRDPNLNIGLRLVSNVDDQGADIGICIRHITKLHWKQVYIRLSTQAGLNNFDIAQQLYGVVAADVVQAIGGARSGRIRRIAIPSRVRFCYMLQCANNALDDIVYVRKIPLVVTLIENIYGLSSQYVAREDE